MKKKTINKLAAALAFTLSMTGILGGCRNNTNVSPSVEEEVSTPTEESQSEQVSEKEGKLKVMVYDRASIPAEEGDLNNNRWTEWIRANAPVADIEFVPIPKAEAVATMTLQFSSGEGPDLYPTNEAELTMMYQSGMVMPISDEMLDKMPNYKALLEEYPILYKNNSLNGQLCFFGLVQNQGPNHTIVFRRDWLDNLGLELPKTPEDLYDICYAFTFNDPDGNGVNDTWGINMTTDAQRVLSHMFGFGNPEKYKFDENGELVYAWDNIEAWLTFAERLVDDKLVNPDFMTMKADDDQADFLNGRIGIYCTGRLMNSKRLPLFTSFKEAFPDATLDTCALPESEFGKYIAALSGAIGNQGFISSDCSDVDAALAYVNWLYDPDVSAYLMYGPEGVYHEMNEYGTYIVKDEEKNKVEFNWASDYSVIRNATLFGKENSYDKHANDPYNLYLSSDDPIKHELGDLMYKFYEIANAMDAEDPRGWQGEGLPALPDDLGLIKTTADKMVNDILVNTLGDTSKSAAEGIEEAKNTWYSAGGADVDEYNRQYFINAGDSALIPSDFIDLKSAPVMTEAAKANSKLFD